MIKLDKVSFDAYVKDIYENQLKDQIELALKTSQKDLEEEKKRNLEVQPVLAELGRAKFQFE